MSGVRPEERLPPAYAPVAADKAGFHGRRAELVALRRWLTDHGESCPVRFLVGPAGIGKTRLLGACHAEARAAGRAGPYVDARHVPPVPHEIRAALDRPTAAAGPPLIVIDGLEAWHDVEPWLRDECLPRLPGDLRLLIASRREPGLEWRTDAGWQSLCRVRRLAGLAPGEAEGLLAASGVPDRFRGRLLALADGCPLTLVVAAEAVRARPGAGFPEVDDQAPLSGLLAAFASAACDDAQRRALDAAAVVADLDRDMLARLSPGDDADRLHAWLRGLPFATAADRGVSLHERVRETWLSAMRQKRPHCYERLARRAVACVLDRSGDAGRSLTRAARTADRIADILRPPPRVRRLVGGAAGRCLYPDIARDSDLPALADAIQRREGAASARWFRDWCARRPAGLYVIRDVQGGVRAACLEVRPADVPGAESDPVVRTLRRRAPGHGPLTLIRHWSVGDGDPRDAPEVTRLMTVLAVRLLADRGRRRVAMALAPRSPAAVWPRLLGMSPVAGAVAGCGLRLFHREWGQVSPREHAQALVANLLARHDGGAADMPPAPEFEAAVAAALCHWRNDRALAESELGAWLWSPVPAGDPSHRATAVRAAIERAADGCDARARRLLRRAYFAPAESQRAAARALGMGYSTFRRHLAAARTELTCRLWRDRRRAGAGA
ncbi:hypothetical protein PC39_04807 [Salinisphaera sp. PC39]|uniref:hypothetical protein n=1 Tax=Salinisphaera sp. PC39 TaxID=1304156 RepID=UPI003341809E